jgi:hypothetical protein
MFFQPVSEIGSDFPDPPQGYVGADFPPGIDDRSPAHVIRTARTELHDFSAALSARSRCIGRSKTVRAQIYDVSALITHSVRLPERFSFFSVYYTAGERKSRVS